MYGHGHAISWSKRLHEIRLNGTVSGTRESEALGDRGNYENSLHARKGLANAPPRTGAKRQIDELKILPVL